MIKCLLIASLLYPPLLGAMKPEALQVITSVIQYSCMGIGGSLLAWNIYSTKKEIAQTKKECERKIRDISNSNKEYEQLCLRILSYRLKKMLDERLEEEQKANPHKTLKEISQDLIEYDLEQCRIKEDLSYLWDFVFSQKRSRRKKLIKSIIPKEPHRQDPSPVIIIDTIETEADSDFIHLCATEE